MTWRGRNIYLVGLPGSGKSAIGRELAKYLSGFGYEFRDLDHEIERTARRTVDEIFCAQGESTFRSLESSELQKLAECAFSGSPLVVATGGGAAVTDLNRAVIRGSGVMVFIDVNVREALRNVMSDIAAGKKRPMFEGLSEQDAFQKMRELYEARRAHYEEATLHFVARTSASTPVRSPEELAGELQKALHEMAFHVALKPRFHSSVVKSALGDYPVFVGNGIAAIEFTHFVRLRRPSAVVLVTDTNVAPLHAAPLTAHLKKQLPWLNLHQITLEAGEAHKNETTLRELLTAFHDLRLSRKSSLVATLGGGVVSDIGALAASLYKRGVPVIHMPTTLLAQVDAAIGGKTGIDMFGAKNAIGTFYPPVHLLIDPLFLTTLPKRELHSGLGEILKYALIGASDLWQELEKNIRRLIRGLDASYSELIQRSIAEKVRVVERDEFERGNNESGVSERELLNFGHTFGHALEAATNYSVFLHGEAVILGMRAAVWLSHKKGLLSDDTWAKIEVVLGRVPLKVTTGVAASEIVRWMMQDKKRDVTARVILLKAIGEAFVTEATEEELLAAAEYMIRLL